MSQKILVYPEQVYAVGATTRTFQGWGLDFLPREKIVFSHSFEEVCLHYKLIEKREGDLVLQPFHYLPHCGYAPGMSFYPAELLLENRELHTPHEKYREIGSDKLVHYDPSLHVMIDLFFIMRTGSFGDGVVSIPFVRLGIKMEYSGQDGVLYGEKGNELIHCDQIEWNTPKVENFEDVEYVRSKIRWWRMKFINLQQWCWGLVRDYGIDTSSLPPIIVRIFENEDNR